MNEVAQALAPNDLLIWVWRSVVWVSAAWLLVLSTLFFLRPAIVHRFIDGFVTSGRIDFLEVGVRLIVSLGFVAVSPETRLPILFFWVGVGLAITAFPMMFVHRLQRRQAVWAIT